MTPPDLTNYRYSPRLLVLTPAEAWALPTISGKSDADLDSKYPHRLSWVSLVRNGHLPGDAVAEYRGQLLASLRAGRERRRAEMAAQSDHGCMQATSHISAGRSGN